MRKGVILKAVNDRPTNLAIVYTVYSTMGSLQSLDWTQWTGLDWTGLDWILMMSLIMFYCICAQDLII